MDTPDAKKKADELDEDELESGAGGVGAEGSTLSSGDGAQRARKRPGRVKYGDITLNKGYID